MIDSRKYSFFRALRPFSFSVALIASSLGVLIANQEGYHDWLRSSLIIVAALLAQATTNLINDHGDKSYWKRAETETDEVTTQVLAAITRNTRIGILCGVAASAIGLWLTIKTDLGLLLLCVLGFLGGFYYTAEPVNYKRRGLGVVLVFWFTGVLLVLGAYYGMTASLATKVIWLSVPIAILSSLLLLSNELRDINEDRQQVLQTLTVRLGLGCSRWLYVALLLSCYLFCGYLAILSLIDQLYWLLPSLVVALFLLRRVRAEDCGGALLPPFTGRFFLVFGIGYLLTVQAAAI
ncbi:prenyltransferase [Aestuariirhabdus sp. Z084]|uniref:prenyltransferase n=1 Tax=Aestuariirhabdus haliotis TaxID=2918751 RepID=UPI00201B3600|nr:prenyltransferase [Aestuariirhabdus haliotis]MCL6414515.1 prenyltransferase [Aestuariirhabdus haliotis]MCL6418503.1 prenyltransferase [Aestuariirhabdus haliotis]